MIDYPGAPATNLTLRGIGAGRAREATGVRLVDTATVTTRSKALLAVGGSLVLLSMLLTGVFGYLLAPQKRVLVVTLVENAGQPAREQLKATCGPLPGITVVSDQGNPDPRVQGRFPVRFDIARSDPQQEAALEQCINRFPTLVRGFVSEGDQ